MLRSSAFVLMTLFSLTAVWAQKPQNDFLSYGQYLEIVDNEHPVARLAKIKQEKADAYLLKAKGGFDPKLMANVKQKQLSDKDYYQYLSTTLKVPTWFGIEGQVGFNNNDGYYLNPEATNVAKGIWHAGISVNLGKGLFIDQRRADLKQAKILQNSGEQERKLARNQLMLDASLAFFQWNKAFHKVVIYEKNIETIKERLESLKVSFKLGEKAAVDTLKIAIQLQDRKIKYTQAKVELKNKRAYLNTFLWQAGWIPLELEESITPQVDSTNYAAYMSLDLAVAAEQHPLLIIEKNNIEVSMIDYRLKKEALKPTLKLKYNNLVNDKQGKGLFYDYSLQNYTWGATFYYPLFTRKERGGLKAAALDLEYKEIKLVDKTAQVKYKIQASVNQLLSYQFQLQDMSTAVGMYEQLLAAEQNMFELGESSLFLINTRDQNLLAARLKQIEMNFNQQMSEAFVKFQLVAF